MASIAAWAICTDQRRLCDKVRVRRIRDSDRVGTFYNGTFTHLLILSRLALTAQVVPRASAVVPGTANAEPIVIHADHINMVKFESNSDSGYKKISGHLQIMAESAGDVISPRWQEESRVSENVSENLKGHKTENGNEPR